MQQGFRPDASLGAQLSKLLNAGALSQEQAQTILSNPNVAAATTDQAYGVRATIANSRGLTPTDVDVISLARFGAKASDMEDMQADLSAQLGQTQGRQPAYIYIMLGGNDFCSDAPTTDFRTRYQERVMAIHDQYPAAHYIIVPVPPADQLAAIDHSYGPALPGLGGGELSCKSLRQKSCPNIYKPEAAQRVQEINAAVNDVQSQLALTGARVDYVADFAQWPIQADELSIDCFHPSAKGQEAIGRFVSEAVKP